MTDDISNQQLLEALTAMMQAFVTKDYLDERLQGFATKDDLKAFATKDDLKAFATKDYLDERLQAFATKDDLKQMEQRLEQKLSRKIKEGQVINTQHHMETR